MRDRNAINVWPVTVDCSPCDAHKKCHPDEQRIIVDDVDEGIGHCPDQDLNDFRSYRGVFRLGEEDASKGKLLRRAGEANVEREEKRPLRDRWLAACTKRLRKP